MKGRIRDIAANLFKFALVKNAKHHGAFKLLITPKKW